MQSQAASTTAGQAAAPSGTFPSIPICPLSSASLSFLSQYARTQRFRVGQPSNFSIRGNHVYFLRADGVDDQQQKLWQLDVTNGEERLLLKPSDLVKGSEDESNMSAEERQLRERKRMTSRGITAYHICPTSPARMLIPYQAHLYLFDKDSGAVTNLTAESAFNDVGIPSYPQFSPDGKLVAFVRSGDIFMIELQMKDGASDGKASSSISFVEWRVTDTGGPSNPDIVNGVAEFVAQEELMRYVGMWFSPDSTQLLFQSTNTSQLEKLAIFDPTSPWKAPTFRPYPRAGKQNAEVKLGIIQIQRPSSNMSMQSKTDAQGDVELDGESSGSARKRKRTSTRSSATTTTPSSSSSSPSTPPIPTPTWLEWDRESFPYVCTVTWSVRSPLTIVVQNRLQNWTRILCVVDRGTSATAAATGKTKLIWEEKDSAWLNVDQSVPHWLKDGSGFLWSSEQTNTEEGWPALFLHDAQGKRVRMLHDPTAVKYRKLIHVDETRDVAYVLGGDATEQHIWRISLSGDNTKQQQLTSTAGVHSATFAPATGSSLLYVHERATLEHETQWMVRRLPETGKDGSGEMDTSSTTSTSSDGDGAHGGSIVCAIRSAVTPVPQEFVPRVELKRLSVSEQVALDEEARSQHMIRQEREHNPLTKLVREQMTKVKDQPVQLPAGTSTPTPATLTFNTATIRPHSFDAHTRYPVILFVYGGPFFRMVSRERTSFLLQQWIANQGYIVVVGDNRGTPYRGRQWERCLHHDFHTLPLRDQVMIVRGLAASDPSMDLTPGVGVFGWSFGGSMSALAVMRYPSLFGAGFVGAAGTNWRLYDTTYTERILGIPTIEDDDGHGDDKATSSKMENPCDAYYARSNVLTYARDLLRPLLLVHGTTDDNVYVAHAVQLAQELFKHGREFTYLPLAGTHMLADPTAMMHMYTRLILFFMQHIPANRC